jgi:hypothetical protein
MMCVFVVVVFKKLINIIMLCTRSSSLLFFSLDGWAKQKMKKV